MLERVNDPFRYLAVIRHPEVEPYVTLGEIVSDAEIASHVTNPENVLLMADHGGFLFVQQSPEVYEVHTAFTPDGRGPAILRLANESLAYMFQRTEALAIRTFVAHNNRAARRLALGVGFVPLREAAALGTLGIEYLLTVKQWVRGQRICQSRQSVQ